MTTMTDRPGEAPSLRQQLGLELRRLRDLAGIGGRGMAARVGISQATLSRLEAGTRAPSIPEVLAYCSAASADPETTERLATLAEQAKAEAAPWRTALAGRAHMQEDAAATAETATLIRQATYDLVPGLLQTAEYATALFPLVTHTMTGHDTTAAVAARLRRQEILYNPAQRFEFLISETVLRWAPAPDLMPAQLAKIKAAVRMSNVWLGILPLGAPLGLAHTFTLYDEPTGDHEPTVAIELPHGRLTLTDPTDIAPYRDTFNRNRTHALTGKAVTQLIQRIAAS